MKKKVVEQVNSCFFPSIRQKKGQFFILAAVIIASVIYGMNATKNILSGSDKPEDFFLLGEQISEELNNVIDYSIVSGNDNVSDFINKTVFYINHTKAPTEIVFIYLNNGNISVENHAKNDITSIYATGFSACPTISDCSTFSGQNNSYALNSYSGIVNVSIGSENYLYDLSRGSKSYIVLKRTVGREVYIDVKN